MKTTFLILLLLISFNSLASATEGQNVATNVERVNTENDKDVNKEEKKTEKKELNKRFTISPEMQAAMANKDKAVSDGLTSSERFMKYLKSGVVHIIPRGLDHILFVLGLFLSTVVFSKLVWQITAFTLAHTITLGLASVGWISLPASVVEPLIALSIAYVAIENIRHEEPGRFRLPVIFAFGLLHGLGFAYVLGEFGLPTDSMLLSLLAFNIGVELGQLAIVAGALVLLYKWSKQPSYRMFVQVPLSLIIGGFGLFWLVERIL